MNHVMIDLETLDTAVTAKIVAIGAICFNPNTGLRGDEFYSLIKHKNQRRTKSQATINWWNQQDKEVRKQLKGKLPLEKVLDDFEFWLPDNCIVWGNGSTFDISILEHAYIQHNINIPWKFWNVMDCRTVRKLYEEKRGGLDQNFSGTKHNALDDAIYQADYISKMWRALKK